ncbi:MAG: tetratricopeptide repeat protein [Stigonema ocellatum SAG 48.90 = DSM 106950]|nr:tetratricopeptide repeat protein [Stigonema ocellatum SAG 48.90 = DSM 106950]
MTGLRFTPRRKESLFNHVEKVNSYSDSATPGTYHQLGMVAQEMREFSEARRNYQLALEIYIEFGDRYWSAKTYHALGLLAEAQENYAEARANLHKALEIYVEYKDDYWAGSAREVLERLPE